MGIAFKVPVCVFILDLMKIQIDLLLQNKTLLYYLIIALMPHIRVIHPRCFVWMYNLIEIQLKLRYGHPDLPNC